MINGGDEFFQLVGQQIDVVLDRQDDLLASSVVGRLFKKGQQ